MKTIKFVHVNAKCSDCCTVELEDDKSMFYPLDPNYTSHGYVPNDIGIGRGDYIDFTIDNETGKILNWVPITSLKGKDNV